MKLYLLTNEHYDKERWSANVWTQAVVSAPNEYTARRISPSDAYAWSETHQSWMFLYPANNIPYTIKYDQWVMPEQLKVEVIGDSHVAQGLILSSYDGE